jgi:hypothetical protein
LLGFFGWGCLGFWGFWGFWGLGVLGFWVLGFGVLIKISKFFLIKPQNPKTSNLIKISKFF